MKEKIELVKELISLAEENDLAELSVEFKGLKVEIKKETPIPSVMQSPSVVQHTPPQSKTEESEKPQKPKGIPVKSPLSGVFYRAPKPGAPPFVNVGDVVEKDQTLCIVEAMKLMNEIAAEFKCKILEICKENAEVTNEGDVLFYVEKVQ